MMRTCAVLVVMVGMFLGGCGNSNKPTDAEVKVFTSFTKYHAAHPPDLSKVGREVQDREDMSVTEKSDLIKAKLAKIHGESITNYLKKADKSERPIFENWKQLEESEFVGRFDVLLHEILLKIDVHYAQFVDSKAKGARRFTLDQIYGGLQVAL